MTDLDAIRARLAAATPGPWKAHNYGRKEPWMPAAEAKRYGWVAFSAKRDENYTTSPLERPDAAFIAAAPDDIAALLERVDELETALERIANYTDRRFSPAKVPADIVHGKARAALRGSE